MAEEPALTHPGSAVNSPRRCGVSKIEDLTPMGPDEDGFTTVSTRSHVISRAGKLDTQWTGHEAAWLKNPWSLTLVQLSIRRGTAGFAKLKT
jgi:hypothetical protein